MSQGHVWRSGSGLGDNSGSGDPSTGDVHRPSTHPPGESHLGSHRAPGAAERSAFRSPQHYTVRLEEIVRAYDSWIIRNYCRARFVIININILHILSLCLRKKQRVLDIGCGFGLFGCYFAKLYPDISYLGIDSDPQRVKMANLAARRLGLENAVFEHGDARDLTLGAQFDAIMMVDLMHHIDDASKRSLLETCVNHLDPEGALIIKDVTTHPFAGIAFTWVLDVLMTQGFDMWYWNETQFHSALGEHFGRIDTFPISDWLPYPHIAYLADGLKRPLGLLTEAYRGSPSDTGRPAMP